MGWIFAVVVVVAVVVIIVVVSFLFSRSVTLFSFAYCLYQKRIPSPLKKTNHFVV